jgi:aldose 1-epimerase
MVYSDVMARIEQRPFGQADGQEVSLFTLTNSQGMVLKVTNYGATVTELWVPDRQGRAADVVLGFAELDGYLGGCPFFGATIGRVANRIRGGRFELEGHTYELETNDPPDHLHGSSRGWDKVVWQADPAGGALRLDYRSSDGEAGYPGQVDATTLYTLTDDNELRIEMEASTDRTTLVNMTHHGYFNLAGHDSGTILEHELLLHADHYTPGDPVVPTGALVAVENTVFDFTKPKTVGRDLGGSGGDPVGFDHNWVVRGDPRALRPVARLKDPKSGRVMELSADQPAVQFYTGKFLDGTLRGKGTTYKRYAGLCLETQKCPNSINVPAWRDEVVLRPGEKYRHVVIHSFSIE